MSSSVRTALQSIQAHGGPQMKAKRFADDAQDFCNSPQRRHRCGTDAVRDPASLHADGIERARRDLGHLSPAQSVRRRVRARAQRLCREARRQQAGRIRHQRHAVRPRSAFELHGRQELPRHAGADPRRIRRARHRGHDGRRPDQGGLADRRHAGIEGRHHGQRHHHQSRRRSRAGPHPQPGRREDARAGQHQDQAEDRPQGPGQSDRRHAGARQHPRPLGARARRGRRHRLYPHHHLQRADHRGPEAARSPTCRTRSATS